MANTEEETRLPAHEGGCWGKWTVTRPRTYKTEGVVLKQTPLGEADRIFSLYTLGVGKLRAVARGVRRPRSRLGGHLQPLSQVRVSLALGRNLDAITEAETIRSFRRIKENLPRLSEGVYLAELVDGFSVEQSPNQAIYDLLLEALTLLDAGEREGLLARYFELRLLVHSGFGPELYRCVECRSMLEPADHVYSCARGGVLCGECRVVSNEALYPLSLNAMKVLRLFQRESCSKVMGLRLSDALLGEVERLLGAYVRHVLERDLRSAEFVRLVASGPRGKGVGGRATTWG